MNRISAVDIIQNIAPLVGGGGGGPGGGKGGHGFGMSGEARPLGFVIITKKETKFVSVGKVPRK